MQTLFSPDSKFMQAMSRIADLLILNVLFLLTCVPVVTIGAGITTLYTVVFRFGTDREQGLVKSYFRGFRDNFRQGTVLWLIVLLCGVTSGLNTYVFYRMPGAAHYAFLLFAILFVLVFLISGFLFPLLSQFSNDNKSTLRNAIILSLGYLPRSILIAGLNLLPFVMMLLDFYSFLQIGFIWAALYFSSAAYANSFLLKKVFAPYLAEENTAP